MASIFGLLDVPLGTPGYSTLSRRARTMASISKAMQWKPFQFSGKVYDLAHLHPRSVTYEQPAKGDAPARAFRVDAIFGLRCFTRGRDQKVPQENALLYGDDREIRVFDFVRHELSKRLPEIIERLPQRKCYHTGKGNFFSVEIVRGDGRVVEYDIFFVATRSSARGKINLYVQSAYVRDAEHASNRPDRKPIGSYLILFNTQNNKPINVPK